MRHCRSLPTHSRWGARGVDARSGRGLGIESAAMRKRNANAAGGRWIAPTLRADPVVAWPDIPRTGLVGFTLLYKCFKTLQMRHYAPQFATVRGGRRAFEGETQIRVAQEDRGSLGGRSGGSNIPWRSTLRYATVRRGFCSLCLTAPGPLLAGGRTKSTSTSRIRSGALDVAHRGGGMRAGTVLWAGMCWWLMMISNPYITLN